MMQEVRNQLQDEIKKAEDDLKMKKLLLDQLSRKPKRDFVETPVGRGIQKFIAISSEPFANAHKSAVLALKDPTLYKATKALRYADKILFLCKRVKDNTVPAAKKFALKAAETRVNLEYFVEIPEMQQLVQEHIVKLHSEVERLRPPRTEAQRQQAESVANSFTQAAEDLINNLRGANPQEA